jgi:hypothetical protein
MRKLVGSPSLPYVFSAIWFFSAIWAACLRAGCFEAAEAEPANASAMQTAIPTGSNFVMLAPSIVVQRRKGGVPLDCVAITNVLNPQFFHFDHKMAAGSHQ